MRPLPTLLTLAIAAAFGGFVATGINAHLDNRADAAPLPAVLPTTAALPAAVAGQAVPSLAPMLEKAMPAVVSVNTKQVVRVRNPSSTTRSSAACSRTSRRSASTNRWARA
jgi:serine protease Do